VILDGGGSKRQRAAAAVKFNLDFFWVSQSN
jgi:hypothetical protein